MYLQNHPLKKITEVCDIKLSTLKNYTREWSKEKNTNDLEIIKTLMQPKQKLLQGIAEKGLVALDQTLEKVVNGELELGPQGITQLSNLIKMLHSISNTSEKSEVKEDIEVIKSKDPLEE